MKKYKIQVVQDKAGHWFWHIVAIANGKILAHSEQYDSKRNAADTAKAVFGNKFELEIR